MTPKIKFLHHREKYNPGDHQYHNKTGKDHRSILFVLSLINKLRNQHTGIEIKEPYVNQVI